VALGRSTPETDLSPGALDEVMPWRPLRVYPALLSSDADAQAWARAGAPDGALVVADYQAAPRGRGGLVWQVQPGHGLCFSLVTRPSLPGEREGWLYTAALSGIADVVQDQASAELFVEWPDELYRVDRRAGAVGVTTELGAAGGLAWAVVSVLITDAEPPRGPLLVSLVEAMEARIGSTAEPVLEDYRVRCATLGRNVVARMIPLGPAGPTVTGRAVDCRDDGSLVLETSKGNRVAVQPHHLGMLEKDTADHGADSTDGGGSGEGSDGGRAPGGG
jgi:BirA family biotin operon repressor/biotin-[acetyl-CoA-carboxylase] ligase